MSRQQLRTEVLIRSLGANFAAFEILANEALNGRAFVLRFAGCERPYAPGEVFDFTAVSPAGVAEFRVAAADGGGFDAVTPGLPFAHDFRFVSNDIANVEERTIERPLPEQAARISLASYAGALASTWRRRRRHFGF